MSSPFAAVIIRPENDYFVITHTDSGLKFMFKPDDAQDEMDNSVLKYKVPKSVYHFTNSMHLGPDELTNLTKKNGWLQQMPSTDDLLAPAIPLPPNWHVNPLYEAAQDAYVGDAQAASAADLGEFNDLLAALQDAIASLELEQDMLIALAVVGGLAPMVRKRQKQRHDKLLQRIRQKRDRREEAGAMTKTPTNTPSPVMLFDSSDSFTITVVNETNDDWTLTSLLDSTDVFGVWKVSQSPPNLLKASDTGSGTLSMYANAVFLGMGPQTLHAVWQSTTGTFFGAQIQVPMQIWHLGPPPYCQYSTDGSTWTWPGPDSTSSQNLSIGSYTVVITASGTGTSFSMQCRLTNTSST